MKKKGNVSITFPFSFASALKNIRVYVLRWMHKNAWCVWFIQCEFSKRWQPIGKASQRYSWQEAIKVDAPVDLWFCGSRPLFSVSCRTEKFTRFLVLSALETGLPTVVKLANWFHALLQQTIRGQSRIGVATWTMCDEPSMRGHRISATSFKPDNFLN